jgi:alpha-galactosidase
MREMADALLSTGLAGAGYTTVNVVCNGWTGRDPTTGVLQENRTLWPDGISSLAKYLHSNGLQLGCYTSPANNNCCGEPGSLGYEALDMQTFAEWGCDHVMVDWCRPYVNPLETRAEYAKFGEAIANSSNPAMVYGIWPNGEGKSWKWAADVGGSYWRTASDISNSWDLSTPGQPRSPTGGSVLHNFDVAYSIPEIAQKTGPGKFTFLDQMVVGVVPDPSKPRMVPGPGLSDTEAQAHMSMWVMAASPLLTCNDVRNMSAAVRGILTNEEVLAVHKDPAVAMATRIDVGGGIEETHCLEYPAWSAYGRELADGSTAVMVLNRAATSSVVLLPVTAGPRTANAPLCRPTQILAPHRWRTSATRCTTRITCATCGSAATSP